MVKVKVFGAGSLEVEGMPRGNLLYKIKELLQTCESLKITEIKRGPKKKAVSLSSDSEVENTDQ